MQLDYTINDFFINHRLSILNDLFILLSTIGNGMIIWILLTIILIILKKKYKLIKIFIVGYLCNGLIADIILKNLIARPRPSTGALITIPTSYSMPSGHSSASFIAATLLSFYFPKYRYLFFILASLIAFSRIYVGVHYFSDVIVGSILGIVIGIITIKLFNKIEKGD